LGKSLWGGLMANILDKIKINELKGDDYIVVFPKEVLDMGYHECNCIMHSLERRFPQKTFIGIPENIEFKEYNKKELEQVIEFIQKEIESRDENGNARENREG
jgi:hypothetical protein